MVIGKYINMLGDFGVPALYTGLFVTDPESSEDRILLDSADAEV